jgi:hypothetical protein
LMLCKSSQRCQWVTLGPRLDGLLKTLGGACYSKRTVHRLHQCRLYCNLTLCEETPRSSLHRVQLLTRTPGCVLLGTLYNDACRRCCCSAFDVSFIKLSFCDCFVYSRGAAPSAALNHHRGHKGFVQAGPVQTTYVSWLPTAHTKLSHSSSPAKHPPSYPPSHKLAYTRQPWLQSSSSSWPSQLAYSQLRQ